MGLKYIELSFTLLRLNNLVLFYEIGLINKFVISFLLMIGLGEHFCENFYSF